MQEIIGIFDGVLFLVSLIGGVLAAVFFGISGILWMIAAGDPQKQSLARNAFLGTFIGLCVVGLAGLIPGIVSNLVIEPAGGVPVSRASSSDCDRHLQNQLEIQLTANNYARVQALIGRIQQQRESCSQELWNPQALTESLKFSSDGSYGWKIYDACYHKDGSTLRVGSSYGENIPVDLRQSGLDLPLKKTTRAPSGNFVLYFQPGADRLPNNGASCWIYLKTRDVWLFGPTPAS